MSVTIKLRAIRDANPCDDRRYFLRTGSDADADAAYTERKWQMAELVRIMDLPDTPESRILDMPERSAK